MLRRAQRSGARSGSNFWRFGSWTARHMDFKTTRRYLDITIADQAAAVNKLPTHRPDEPDAQRATGTDGKAVENVQQNVQQSHVANGHGLSLTDTTNKPGDNAQSLKGGAVGHRVSPPVTNSQQDADVVSADQLSAARTTSRWRRPVV